MKQCPQGSGRRDDRHRVLVRVLRECEGRRSEQPWEERARFSLLSSRFSLQVLRASPPNFK